MATPTQQPLYLQRKGYPAKMDRQFIGDIFSPGVRSLSDLNVTASGTSRGVVVAAGGAYVPGNQSGNQGTYRVFTDTPTTLAIDAASLFPRVDQVIVRVYDSVESGTLDQATIEVLKGVEVSGASLDNRNGAITSLPPNMIRLFDVLAPVGSGNLSGVNLRDRRTIASFGGGGSLPIGTQLAYSGSVLPTEGGVWDWADGGLIDRMTFSIFFDRAQHAYNNGVDPGGMKVRKPDKRGKSPVGALDMGTGAGGGIASRVIIGRGASAGSTTHTHTGSTPDHLHGVTGVDHLHVIAAEAPATDAQGYHGHTSGMGTANRGSPNGYTSGAGESVAFTDHVHSLTIDAAPAHAHTVNAHSHGGATGAADRSLATATSGSDRSLAFTTSAMDQTHPVEADNWIVRIA